MTIDRDDPAGGTDPSFVDVFDVATAPDLSLDDPFDSPVGPGSEAVGGPSGGPAGAWTNGERRQTDPLAGVNGDEPSAEDFGSLGGEDTWRVSRLTYGRNVRVLLVESDPARAAAFERAAEESVLQVTVEQVDGLDAAVDRLGRRGSAIRRRVEPDIMLISLEITEAHRLLDAVQRDTRHDSLPIIVLADTGSAEAERRSFALGATGHLVAPRQDYERVALIHALPDFMPSARARAQHADLEHRR